MSTATPFPKVRHIYDPGMPQLLRASDHQPAPVKWLWPNRIPLGSITLLAGDPGAGKSLFALDLAARVSTGSPWPDEPKAEGGRSKAEGQPPTSDPRPSPLPLPPSSVLILSATDHFHDTILPRLAAAGADGSRVYSLDNVTNLRTEMEKLRTTIDDLPNLKLLVIDPINFYVGPGDAHFQTVVRSVLQPLAELARKKNFAILAITHFRKNDGRALERSAGSMGFVSTARTIWTITQDDEDPSRRYLIPLKNNLTAPLPTLAFHITAGEMTKDECPRTNEPAINDPQFVIRHSEIRHSPTAPHLHWGPTPAARGLAPPNAKPQRTTPRDEAKRFLESALAGGPRPAEELIEAADARGLTRRTVQRAFHDLEGCTTKRGYSAGWWWSLGEYPIGPIPDLPEIHLAAEPTYATDVASNIAALRRTELLRQLASEFLTQPPPVPPTKPRTQPTTNTRPSQQTHSTHAQHTKPATPTPCSKPPAPGSPLSPPPTRSPSPHVSPSPKPRRKTPPQPQPPVSPSPAVSPSGLPHSPFPLPTQVPSAASCATTPNQVAAATKPRHQPHARATDHPRIPAP
jgi:putative DNA primase/helicase